MPVPSMSGPSPRSVKADKWNQKLPIIYTMFQKSKLLIFHHIVGER